MSVVPDTEAGVNFTLVITAVDASGNRRGDNGNISIVDTTGTVQPTVGTMVNGIATVLLSVTQAMIGDQITVTWQSAPTVMGTTNLFTVTTGPPSAIVLAATPNAINPGGDTSVVNATVTDAYGNPVSGRTVNLSLVSGPADAALSPLSGTTDTNGQVTTTLTSGSETGTVTIQAECEGTINTIDVTISSFFVYLPIVMRNYTGVDLQPVAGSLRVIDHGGGHYDVEITIKNVGPNMLTADFWVDLYVDPTAAIDINVLWNDVSTYGKAWYVHQDLAPGQTVTLKTTDPDDRTNPRGTYSNWPSSFSPGAHTLWVQVDSYGLPSIGSVIETDETNNISGSHSMP
jgi:hypothetical protein